MIRPLKKYFKFDVRVLFVQQPLLKTILNALPKS